jgi:hypothetical protein
MLVEMIRIFPDENAAKSLLVSIQYECRLWVMIHGDL